MSRLLAAGLGSPYKRVPAHKKRNQVSDLRDGIENCPLYAAF